MMTFTAARKYKRFLSTLNICEEQCGIRLKKEYRHRSPSLHIVTGVSGIPLPITVVKQRL